MRQRRPHEHRHRACQGARTHGSHEGSRPGWPRRRALRGRMPFALCERVEPLGGPSNIEHRASRRLVRARGVARKRAAPRKHDPDPTMRTRTLQATRSGRLPRTKPRATKRLRGRAAALPRGSVSVEPSCPRGACRARRRIRRWSRRRCRRNVVGRTQMTARARRPRLVLVTDPRWRDPAPRLRDARGGARGGAGRAARPAPRQGERRITSPPWHASSAKPPAPSRRFGRQRIDRDSQGCRCGRRSPSRRRFDRRGSTPSSVRTRS